MSDKNRQIAFYGTEEYRRKLQKEALDREIKVQQLIEEAIELYLTGLRPTTSPKGHSPEIEMLLEWWNDPPDNEAKMLREYVRLKLRSYKEPIK